MKLINKGIIVNQLYTTNNKQLRSLRLFWIGFIVYSAGALISATPNANFIICQLLQSSGLFLIIPGAINLTHFKIENDNLKLLYACFCIWSLIIILRGFQFNYLFLKQMLFDQGFGIFPYLAPLILLFPKKLEFYKKIFDVIVIFGILFIIITLKSMMEGIFL